jgi:hypothetical protein
VWLHQHPPSYIFFALRSLCVCSFPARSHETRTHHKNLQHVTCTLTYSLTHSLTHIAHTSHRITSPQFESYSHHITHHHHHHHTHTHTHTHTTLPPPHSLEVGLSRRCPFQVMMVLMAPKQKNSPTDVVENHRELHHTSFSPLLLC